MLRTWRHLFCHLAGRIVDEVLKVFTEQIGSASKSMHARLPLWKSCFGPNEFNEELAIELMVDCQAAIVTGHNELHNLVTDCSSLSQDLGISPPIDKHPVTSAAIAVAKESLKDGREALVIAKGCVAFKNKNTVDGPKKAKQLIEKHGEEFKSLPEEFWRTVRLGASHSLADPNDESKKQTGAPLQAPGPVCAPPEWKRGPYSSPCSHTFGTGPCCVVYRIPRPQSHVVFSYCPGSHGMHREPHCW